MKKILLISVLFLVACNTAKTNFHDHAEDFQDPHHKNTVDITPPGF